MDVKQHFNPRPREEGDPVTLNGKLDVYDFNPRPREEGDSVPSTVTPSSFYFNPRPREEGDHLRYRYTARQRYFNPRPREEGDFRKGKTLVGLFRISIHALVKRATCNGWQKYNAEVISIHALVKRATVFCCRHRQM